jgi:hypothetical protein
MRGSTARTQRALGIATALPRHGSHAAALTVPRHHKAVRVQTRSHRLRMINMAAGVMTVPRTRSSAWLLC